MQFSVETTQGLERRLSFTIPADQIDVEVKDRLKRLAKTQRIDGFRPGKVPVSVIQKRYGNAVRQEVAGESMQRNFVDAIVKEKLNPAGTPRFEATKNESGADLEFVATFEVYPEIEVADLAKMSVEKPVVEIKDKDLNNMMKTLQKQHGEWTEVKRKIKKTDKVTINFTGTIDSEAFEGGTAEDFVLELGQNKMIPGFEDSIIGAKTGEEVVSDVTFPEDYHAENLKGKAAQFTITITKTEELKLPKVDEEFAKLFGIESGDVEELKAEVSNNMTRELEQKLKAVVKEQVLNALIEANDIEIPKSLIDQEIDALRNQAIERYTGGQSGANVPELPAELFAENAKRRVSIGLLLGEVIKSNEIKVDEDRVKALIETMASAYEDPQEVVDYYYNNKELLQQMHHVAMEEQAIETILEKAKVKEVKKSFDDVMNKQ